jgi:hypothetical protein
MNEGADLLFELDHLFEEAADHLAEVTFDGGTKVARADLRPRLPLVLCW